MHHVFGASNVAKLIQDLPVEKREECVQSLSYEAETRISDPVHGCLGQVMKLHRMIKEADELLEETKNKLANYEQQHLMPLNSSTRVSSEIPPFRLSSTRQNMQSQNRQFQNMQLQNMQPQNMQPPSTMYGEASGSMMHSINPNTQTTLPQCHTINIHPERQQQDLRLLFEHGANVEHDQFQQEQQHQPFQQNEEDEWEFMDDQL